MINSLLPPPAGFFPPPCPRLASCLGPQSNTSALNHQDYSTPAPKLTRLPHSNGRRSRYPTAYCSDQHRLPPSSAASHLFLTCRSNAAGLTPYASLKGMWSSARFRSWLQTGIFKAVHTELCVRIHLVDENATTSYLSLSSSKKERKLLLQLSLH